MTNNYSSSQSQQQIQAKISKTKSSEWLINLLYAEGTTEKLCCILRSHKIRFNFYTKSTLHKLLCKPEDQVAKDDKNNIDY